jgi:c-di-GMP-binding flagellar brake protein YcgR
MFQDTRPAPLGDDTDAARWAEFRVDHPREVQALLRDLRDGSVLVHLSGPQAHLTTTLWSMDSQTNRLSFSANDGLPQLQALIDGDEAVAVAYLDSVKLQFDLSELVLVHGAQSCALRARWPGLLYRFQRRASFRVRSFEKRAPQALLRHPSMPEMRLALVYTKSSARVTTLYRKAKEMGLWFCAAADPTLQTVTWWNAYDA